MNHRDTSTRRAIVTALASIGLVLAVVTAVGAGAGGGDTAAGSGAVAAGAAVNVATPGAASASAHVHVHTVTGVIGDDGHHHAESRITLAELPPATRAQVDRVIALWSHKYRIAADAEKDGWVKATKSLYGIGSHYLHGGVTGFLGAKGFDLEHPNIMLFDGEGPDAKFAGVSYIVGGATPEGFAGPYDVWHRHSAVCFAQGLVISEGENEGSPINLGDAECKRRGGIMFPISSLSMIHLWIGPCYTDAPIFAHDNPKLYDGYQPAAT